MRRYRSLAPPTVLILALTGAGVGCDTQASRQRRAEAAQRRQQWEDGQRRQAETEPPTAEVMEQVKTAIQSFLAEHHPDLQVEDTTYTPLTPNLFLVGAAVHDQVHDNRYVAQLSAERLRDVTWGEDEAAPSENGQLLWLVDYADADKMRTLAQRHGFGEEVDRIRELDQEPSHRASWGHRSWLDDYLIWHLLFHRPSSYGYRAGAGFTAMMPGFRPQDPGHPITGADAQRFQAAASPTGGRSMVFLGGGAPAATLVSSARSLSGQAFLAGHGGGIAGKAAMGSVSRGGFGAAGHAAGAGG